MIHLRHLLELCLSFVRKLQDGLDNEEEVYYMKNTLKNILKEEKNLLLVQGFQSNIQKFQKFYVSFCKNLLSLPEISMKLLKIFKISTELIIKCEEYSNDKEYFCFF